MGIGKFVAETKELVAILGSSLGTRPAKNRKGGSGKQGGVEVYTAEC